MVSNTSQFRAETYMSGRKTENKEDLWNPELNLKEKQNPLGTALVKINPHNLKKNDRTLVLPLQILSIQNAGSWKNVTQFSKLHKDVEELLHWMSLLAHSGLHF